VNFPAGASARQRQLNTSFNLCRDPESTSESSDSEYKYMYSSSATPTYNPNPTSRHLDARRSLLYLIICCAASTSTTQLLLLSYETAEILSCSSVPQHLIHFSLTAHHWSIGAFVNEFRGNTTLTCLIIPLGTYDSCATNLVLLIYTHHVV
jgi:hypothetical protein